MKLRLRSILAALALFLGPSSAAFADPGPNIPDVLSTAEQSIRSAVGGQEEFCTEIATDANTNTFSFPALSDDSNANGGSMAGWKGSGIGHWPMIWPWGRSVRVTQVAGSGFSMVAWSLTSSVGIGTQAGGKGSQIVPGAFTTLKNSSAGPTQAAGEAVIAGGASVVMVARYATVADKAYGGYVRGICSDGQPAPGIGRYPFCDADADCSDAGAIGTAGKCQISDTTDTRNTKLRLGGPILRVRSSAGSGRLKACLLR